MGGGEEEGENIDKNERRRFDSTDAMNASDAMKATLPTARFTHRHLNFTTNATTFATRFARHS